MFLFENKIKNMKTYITYFLLGIFTILLPLKPFVVTVILFVLADTIFGVCTAIKLGGWESFRSGKLFNFPVKIFFYAGSIVLSYFVDKHIFEGQILGVTNLLTKACTMLWIYIEVKSMDETSMKLGNKSLWVILKEMISRVKKFKQGINEIDE